MPYTTAEQVLEDYRQSKNLYEGFARELRRLIVAVCDQDGITVGASECRAKPEESLRRNLLHHMKGRLDRRELEELGDIPDLCGVRIVLLYRSDVEKVEQAIDQEISIVERHRHDQLGPALFGYRSTHLRVQIDERRAHMREWLDYRGLTAEVQLRTVLEHSWAVIGPKLDYTEEASAPQHIRRELNRIAAIFEIADEALNQYRARVDSLRQAYSQQVARHDWLDLDLDQESLMAAVHRLPLREAYERGITSGFLPLTSEFSNEGVLENSEELSDFLLLAHAAGIRTIRHLQDVVYSVGQYQNQLAAVAQQAARNGYRPYAAVLDVLAISILSHRPSLLETWSPRIRRELLSAIRHVIADQGSNP